MPAITIHLSDVKQIQNIVTFTATDASGRVIERTLDRADIDNWVDFSTWLINQDAPDYQLLPDKEKTLDITFHNEVVTNPETGAESTIRVVDDIVVK